MNNHFSRLGRYVSIFDRLMKMYYDHGLSDYEIGWGQQFYVEYLYDNPGATPQEMAGFIRVDKGTLTKMIKKLTDVGYVIVTGDEKDRRIKHLFLTEKALPAARKIKSIHDDFYNTLREGISPEDMELTEQTLQHMVNNINAKVWHRMEEKHGAK